MESDFSINPGLDVWLGIQPQYEGEFDDEDWDEEEFKVTQKRRTIHIRRKNFRQNF